MTGTGLNGAESHPLHIPRPLLFRNKKPKQKEKLNCRTSYHNRRVKLVIDVDEFLKQYLFSRFMWKQSQMYTNTQLIFKNKS